MMNCSDLQAVLVSSDPVVLDSVSSSLKQLGISAALHQQTASALKTLIKQKTDAFFVDREVDPDLSVLKAMRSSSSSRTAVGFAIVSRQCPTGVAFRVADFVMDKPLASSRLDRTLRAAYGIMLKERIRYYRHSYRTEATLVDATHRTLLVQTTNISQTGMALECPAQLNARDVVQLQFSLAANRPRINCKAQVIWTAENGKTGLAFTEMSKTDKDRLALWIHDEFHRNIDPSSPTGSIGRPADATA